MTDQDDGPIDWVEFARAREELGYSFIRLLGYFREDGIKSIAAIEDAVRKLASAPIVLPAHKLKTEAREFGALKLGDLAEEIEFAARNFVEWHQDPSALVEQVVQLRPLFEASMAALDDATNPLVQRRPPSGSAVARRF